MQIQRSIETKLAENLTPEHLEVVNESHMHFKVIVVSPQFDGLNRVRRHQAVNAVLADELAGPVHALSMETYTSPEWQARGGRTLASPQCMGGSKADQA